MKNKITKTIIFITFFVIGWFLAGCQESPREDSAIGQLLSGEHILHEIKVINDIDDDDRNIKPNKPVYFLFSNTSMTFNVTLNDSNVVTMNLPISRVRFRYDEMITQPYVKFKWLAASSVEDVADIQRNILYIVLFVNKEDVVYNIPVNEKQ